MCDKQKKTFSPRNPNIFARNISTLFRTSKSKSIQAFPVNSNSGYKFVNSGISRIERTKLVFCSRKV